MSDPFTLAILTGHDSPATCRAVAALAALPRVRIVGILLDSGRAPFRTRLRNLARSSHRAGWSSPLVRLGGVVDEVFEALASRVVRRTEVSELLRRSFPERVFSVADIGALYNIPLLDVGDLDGPRAAETIRQLGPDLGIVLETGPLPRSTCSMPRRGCIRLNLGKLPEYRGPAPGFWELYDGQRAAGVTVHMADDGPEAGEVMGEDVVEIHPHDSPVTLRRKLETRGTELLARCVLDLAEGRAVPQPQPPSHHPPRGLPTRRHRRQLYGRRPIPGRERSAWIQPVKTILYLVLYYGRLFHLVRAWRSVTGAGRACILLYHRVNDLTDDPLTTSPRRFAEHMLVLRKFYAVLPTADLVEKVRAGGRLPRHAVAVHFDDCYRDGYTEASRVLAELGFPACWFVASGYVDTDRAFPHDAAACPWLLENLRREDLVDLTRRGFEVGSHTVNHVDLGRCVDGVAVTEVVDSKRELEALVGRSVTLLSFPFGTAANIRREVVEVIQGSGYGALFSAEGGYLTDRSDPFELPRVPVSGQTRPLDLLMELEGLSLGALRRRWTRGRRLAR